jgi:lysyl-tRNA synthetase class 2
MAVRTKVEKRIRAFFESRGFLETRTPLLVPCPGMEPHIRPVSTSRGAYLPTSPEFAMKRLLVGGLEKIFQICPAFRDEPHSPHHSPEFTILEWYRAHAGYQEVMKDTEELVAELAHSIRGRSTLLFQGREIDVTPPWPRLKVRDLFLEKGVDLKKIRDASAMRAECIRLGIDPGDGAPKSWDDYSFLIWLNLIEPELPKNRAVFVTHYPPSQAALAVIEKDAEGNPWARRFEAYAGGLELCNAFEELTDPVEQRRRFEEDMDLREKIYGSSFPRTPLDEGFLGALQEGMPPSGGNALGVDRLVMLLADEPDLDYTLWLRSI